MGRSVAWGMALVLWSFVLPSAAMAIEVQTAAEETASEALRQRVAVLEALVRQQQATIEELRKQNGGSASEETAALRQRIDELENVVKELQGVIATLQLPQPETVSTAPEPSASPVTGQPAIPTLGSEKLLPDISFLVDSVSLFSTSRRAGRDRNRVLVREGEFAFQGYFYPNIRGDVFISLEREPGETAFGIDLEEAYASFLNLGKGLQAQAGKKLLDFGRLNQLHNERRLTIDMPLPNKHFLFPEDHGLAGQGLQFNYLLPTWGDLFAQLQLGFWRSAAEEPGEKGGKNGLEEASVSRRLAWRRFSSVGEEGAEEEDGGLGVEDKIYSARLFLSKGLAGGDAELGVGFSGLFGRAPSENGGRDDIRLLGVDVNYRRFFGAYQRLLLQGEMMRHRRSGDGGGSRTGYYLLGAYRWARLWDGGLRYDSSSLPAPLSGHETKLVAFVRRFLTEQSYLRFQLEHNNLVSGRSFSQLGLQFVWGIGPHVDVLE